jgi:phage baseplate assembly protein W
MSEPQYLGWPPTDDGPVVSAEEARVTRMGRIMFMRPGDHICRPLDGVAIDDIIFENLNQGTKVAARQAIRDGIHRLEPGVAIPAGEAGVQIDEIDDKTQITINYYDREEPEVYRDPLVIRMRNV